MKIFYVCKIAKINLEQALGVLRKINFQKKALEKNNVQVELVIYSLNKIELEEGINIYLYKNDEKLNRIQKNISEYRLTKKVEKYLENNINRETDVIYMRDTYFTFNLYSNLSKLGKVFVEVQSDIFDELKIINKKRYFLEKIFKRRYLRNITGFICITKEIYNVEKVYNNKPCYILGNGYDEAEMEFIPKKNKNDKINLLFIVATEKPWHGTERLLNSYLNAKNSEKFVLHIVGLNSIEHKFKNINNLISYGIIKDRSEMDNIFSFCDIGVGTLALYNKGLTEAAPLKVRHYLSKGLPVIIAYEDVDLNENMKYVIRVPNNEQLIDFYELEEKYYSIKEYRESGLIVNEIRNSLSWNKKMKDVIEFISKN